VDMVNYLAVAVVDDHPKMILDTKLCRDNFDGIIKQAQDFWRSFKEIPALPFGNNQKMDTVFRPVIGDDDNLIGFVENIRR